MNRTTLLAVLGVGAAALYIYWKKSQPKPEELSFYNNTNLFRAPTSSNVTSSSFYYSENGYKDKPQIYTDVFTSAGGSNLSPLDMIMSAQGNASVLPTDGGLIMN